MCQIKHGNIPTLKFADDSVYISLLHDNESSYGPVINEFVSWCHESVLALNMAKTKDVASAHETIVIKNQVVDL